MAKFDIDSEVSFDGIDAYFRVRGEGNLYYYGRNKLDYEFYITSIEGTSYDGVDLEITDELKEKVISLFKVNEDDLWEDNDLLNQCDEEIALSHYEAKIDRELDELLGK